MMTSYVYSITNKLNGKMYIGKTNRCDDRFGEHCCAKTYIGNALRKHGKDNFIYKVLYDCPTEEQAYKVEAFYIRLLNTQVPNGYNLDSGGMGGKQVSEETRKKMSDAAKNREPFTDEHKRKISERKKNKTPKNLGQLHLERIGTHHTEETRKKISKTKMGKPGHKHSEEAKRKMSEAKKGNKNSLGCKRSEETKRKIREAWKRRKGLKPIES